MTMSLPDEKNLDLGPEPKGRSGNNDQLQPQLVQQHDDRNYSQNLLSNVPKRKPVPAAGPVPDPASGAPPASNEDQQTHGHGSPVAAMGIKQKLIDWWSLLPSKRRRLIVIIAIGVVVVIVLALVIGLSVGLTVGNR